MSKIWTEKYTTSSRFILRFQPFPHGGRRPGTWSWEYAGFRCRPQRHLFVPPRLPQFLKAVRQDPAVRPKAHTFRLRCRNAFRLPSADIFTLRLGYIAEKLEHDVGDQGPGQVTPLPGIQQGHIQHHNGGPNFRMASSWRASFCSWVDTRT